MTQIIMRPTYNRPEMFALSLEYELAAREYYKFPHDLVTLFVVEAGTPKKVWELIEQYPGEKKIIKREKKLGLSKNILEGMKEAFKETDDFIVYIEDDILLHKTYFQYMDTLLNHPDLGPYSVLSAYNKDDKGDVSEVYKYHFYAALAPIISKEFFTKYIAHCANDNYYNNKPAFVTILNDKYKQHQKSHTYKYKDTQHHQQAGILNRLTDVAMIEEGMYTYMPRVNRQIHVGYYGHNRPGGMIPGKTYEERLNSLRRIITSAEKMYEFSATKQYNDYAVFSDKLENWDGTLRVV